MLRRIIHVPPAIHAQLLRVYGPQWCTDHLITAGPPPLIWSAPHPPRLGDRLAALLHRLRTDAAVRLLQRLNLLPIDCGCPARQARLNALTPRLQALIHPWPLTTCTLLAWLALLLLLSTL